MLSKMLLRSEVLFYFVVAFYHHIMFNDRLLSPVTTALTTHLHCLPLRLISYYQQTSLPFCFSFLLLFFLYVKGFY